MVRHDFQDAGAAEALERLGIIVLGSCLSPMERIAHVILHLVRKGPEVLVA
jgi:hypothetical protein